MQHAIGKRICKMGEGGCDKGGSQKNLKEYKNRDRGEDEKGQKRKEFKMRERVERSISHMLKIQIHYPVDTVIQDICLDFSGLEYILLIEEPQTFLFSLLL